MQDKEKLLALIQDKNLTPIKAIRINCLDCSAGSTKEVRFCEAKYCPVYPYRMGTNPKKEDNPDQESLEIIQDKKLTPLKAIRKKCIDCMCGSYKEIRRCGESIGTKCSLFPYRFGKNPIYNT